MDSYFEQSVTAETGTRNYILYLLCWAACILLLLLGAVFAANSISYGAENVSVNWVSMVVAGLLIVCACILFRLKDVLRREYDYILKDGMLEISCIYNGRRRRLMEMIPMERIGQCAPASGSEYNKARNGASEIHNWFVHADAQLSFITYTNQNKRHMAVLELNDEMLAAMRSSGRMPVGAWRHKEGKSI